MKTQVRLIIKDLREADRIKVDDSGREGVHVIQVTDELAMIWANILEEAFNDTAG